MCVFFCSLTAWWFTTNLYSSILLFVLPFMYILKIKCFIFFTIIDMVQLFVFVSTFSLCNLSFLRFASRLVAWILSRILGASVAFRVGGWKCLRDVVVKFKKVRLLYILLGLLYFEFGYSTMHMYLNLITNREIILWLDVILYSVIVKTYCSISRLLPGRRAYIGLINWCYDLCVCK